MIPQERQRGTAAGGGQPAGRGSGCLLATWRCTSAGRCARAAAPDSTCGIAARPACAPAGAHHLVSRLQQRRHHTAAAACGPGQQQQQLQRRRGSERAAPPARRRHGRRHRLELPQATRAWCRREGLVSLLPSAARTGTAAQQPGLVHDHQGQQHAAHSPAGWRAGCKKQRHSFHVAAARRPVQAQPQRHMRQQGACMRRAAMAAAGGR
jgi:hypothetical protein